MCMLGVFKITDYGHATKFNQLSMSECMLVSYVSELTNLYTECIVSTQMTRTRIGIAALMYVYVRRVYI